ncbi:MAG TPA: hypothetical protein VGK19_13965 [Capsulimonadaceae bacterium]
MPDRLPPFAILNFLVVAVVVGSCYAITPYIGASVLSIIDGVLYGFRWVGMHNPIPSAVILGFFVGTAIGVDYGLQRSGKSGYRKPIILATAATVTLFGLLGFIYRETMPPTHPTIPPAPIAAPANTFPVSAT